MIIKVLGPGCANCVKLEQNTRKALASLDMEADLQKVTDYATIAGYGVLKTPGLIVDEELVLSGKVAGPDEIARLLSDRG